jgi:hypothetical protein
MDQADRSIHEFDDAARKAALDFVIDKGVSTAIGQSKKILDAGIGNAAISTTQDLALHKATLQNFETVQKTFAVTFEDLEKCLLPGSKCNLLEFMRRQDQALQRWMESFMSEGTQTALGRVRAARSLMQNYGLKLAGNGIGSLNAAVGCIGQFQQSAAAAPGDPVDPGSPAVAKAKGGGGSAVKAVIGVTAAGAAGVAGYLALKNGLPNLGGIGGGSGGDSGGISLVSYAFNCSFNAGGVVNSCANSVVVVHVTVNVPVGSNLKLFTDNIFSTGVFTTTTSQPFDATFRGFSGGGWFNQCGPPITQLNLANLSVSTSSIASLSGLSLSIKCS